jgi:cyclopropane fatty-acyl-phospholipid synthase-like methyltransferase
VSGGWSAFFERLRPDSPLYREQSAVYVNALRAAIDVRRTDRVLDFGCGFGFVARLLAPHVSEVWFWDASENMRAEARRTTADLPNARLCDVPAALSEDGDRVAWQSPTFDLILVNSVVQYMDPAEVPRWLARWRAMLSAEGRLIMSDLIAPEHRSLWDVADLLRLGVRRGLALRGAAEALGGVRSYRRTSRTVPLLRVAPDDLISRAGSAELDVEVLPQNLTHFTKRWTAVLRPRRPRD